MKTLTRRQIRRLILNEISQVLGNRRSLSESRLADSLPSFIENELASRADAIDVLGDLYNFDAFDDLRDLANELAASLGPSATTEQMTQLQQQIAQGAFDGALEDLTADRQRARFGDMY